MSRAALELEKAIKEMRAESAKGAPTGRRKGGRRVEQNGKVAAESGNQLTDDIDSVMTDTTNLSGQEGAAGSNDASGASDQVKEGKPTVAKKGNGSAKKGKAPKKTAKAAAEKKERRPRQKVVASGSLKKVEASGTTYITLEFDEGRIVLTPTGNREANRDIAAKALRALLKG